MISNPRGARYRIVRMFERDPRLNKIITTGLTLEEAQAHCRDPETSSSTATGTSETKLTKKLGRWFDALEAESY